MRRAAALAALGLLAGPAAAVELVLPPGAERTLAASSPFDGHAVAAAPFDSETVPVETAEGAVDRQVWRADGRGATVLAVLAPIREQLVADGWTVTFECEARACGGFDFRFALDVAPAPAMFVDLADYRYLAAAHGDARLDVLVSRSGEVVYVQATVVRPGAAATPPAAPAPVARMSTSDAPARPDPADPAAIAEALDRRGRAVLGDLAFPTGSATLPDADAPSLAALAAWLAAHPRARIALVGHTDAEGTTEANLALSRRRAEAVRDRLVARHGIDPTRTEARGVASFAPVAANDTPAGRNANRRVEAVVRSVP